MKKVEKLLYQKYHKKPQKLPENQELYVQMNQKLKAYGLKQEITNDLLFYQQEVLYRGIVNKEIFEEMFLDSYVNMYDYWLDLDYKQRKHQVNVDLQPYIDEMICFTYEGEKIYLPMFDVRMNQIYHYEMVLFVLKQYQRLKHDFKDHIQKDLYGRLPYQSNFCSAHLVYEDGKYWGLYEPKSTTLYFIENDAIVNTICFGPQNEISEQMILAIVDDVRRGHELDLLHHLIEWHLCDRKVEKKLTKMMQKLEKKQAKRAKKQAKHSS